MKDTRALQWIAELDDTRTAITDYMEEGGDTPQDVVALMSVRKFLNAAIKILNDVHVPERVEVCGKYNSVGSVCVKHQGHGGGHCSAFGVSWTDESAARSAATIAKQMTGRTD